MVGGAEVEVVAEGCVVADVEVEVGGGVVVDVWGEAQDANNSPSRSMEMIPKYTVFFIYFPPL